MFLLGSGTSIPSGMPSTKDITEQIMSGKNIFRHTDSRYYISETINDYEKSITKEYLPSVLHLLRTLKVLMEEYDKSEIINYEILFYFARQLHDFESGESVNMAIYPFIKEVKNRIKSDRYIDLFSETENYIKQTVWHLLSKPTANTSQLLFLSDALIDSQFKINISTLNHDTLIEQHLKNNNIKFFDCFSHSKKGVRYWKKQFSPYNNILKIHGSVNWFLLRTDDGDFFDERISIVLNGDIDHAKSINGKLMRDVGFGPLILAGTFNKISEYTNNIFGDMFYSFKQKLKRISSLVIVGYGFRDKGINTAILEWLYSNRNNKIVIIHPNPKGLLTNKARYAIRRSYENHAKNNYIFISKKVENITWNDIKKVIVI